MKTGLAIHSLAFVGASCFAALLLAHSKPDMTGLFSPDWQVRAQTVKRILLVPGALKDPEVQQALIQCQQRENDLLETGDVPDNEGYSDNYLSALEGALFEFAKRNIPDAEAALLRSFYNPDSVIGMFLASHPSNLPALISASHSPSIGLRYAVIGVIGELLQHDKQTNGGNPSIPSRLYEEAKAVLTSSAANQKESPLVRQIAVESLGLVADKADLPLLQRIAISDPSSLKAGEGRPDIYPIREAAIKAIRSISTQSHAAPAQ